jgi:O-antigen/teichoic acid export membrane protein
LISKNFIKSSIIYTLAGTLPMASSLILLPFYIHHLSTEVYGALASYLVFSLLVQIVVTFSFDTSVYIYFHEFKTDKQKVATIISSAFVAMLVIGAVVGMAIIGTSDLFLKLVPTVKNISFYPYGYASMVTGIFQALFKVHSSLLQTREQPETFFWSNLLSFSLIAFFTIVGLQIFPNSLMGPIMGRSIASAICGLWVLARIFGEFGIHTDFSWVRSSLGFNVYNFIYQLLQWFINYFDRIILLLLLSLSEVGIYTFATQCLIALDLVMNSLHSSFYPKVVSIIMSQSSKQSTSSVNRYYHGLIGVMMLLVCAAILFLPWIIETFVKRQSYQETIPYLPYLAALYLFRTVRLYFTSPYSIMKYTKPLPLIYLIVAALKIALMFLFIDDIGVYGAIVASLVSSLVEIVLLRWSLRKLFNFQFNVFKILGAPLILFIFIISLEPLFGLNYALATHLFYFVSCAALLWWAYRHELSDMNLFRRDVL